jgi:hypothetical protein
MPARPGTGPGAGCGERQNASAVLRAATVYHTPVVKAIPGARFERPRRGWVGERGRWVGERWSSGQNPSVHRVGLPPPPTPCPIAAMMVYSLQVHQGTMHVERAMHLKGKVGRLDVPTRGNHGVAPAPTAAAHPSPSPPARPGGFLFCAGLTGGGKEKTMSVVDLERLLTLVVPLNDSPDVHHASARFRGVSLAAGKGADS